MKRPVYIYIYIYCIYVRMHVCMYGGRGKHIADSGNVDPPSSLNGF
jgi:hypothetical protein